MFHVQVKRTLDINYPIVFFKKKKHLLQKIYNRINWLTVRSILQNHDNIIVKLADYFSKNTADQNRRALLSKFPDLLMHYKKLNQL